MFLIAVLLLGSALVSSTASASGPRPPGGSGKPPSPPGTPPPGPLARRLSELMAGLSDDERAAIRSEIPESWWQLFEAASTVPTDGHVTLVLGPVQVEVASFTPEQRSELERSILSSIGMFNALELKSILQEAGVF